MDGLPVMFDHDAEGRPLVRPRSDAADPAAARLLADFLADEVRTDPKAVAQMIERLEAAAGGVTPYGGIGNVLRFDLGARGVRLSDAYRDPADSAWFSFAEMRQALERWRGHVGADLR
ncbi:MAG: hypothetical protein GVY28_06245 [Alphaproteobacteria bacterium]|jgi:hypothetical protein|nr:hypothetical protein [Alphaproteobacteria bacterium]